ncbi:hypothetical protein BDDG_06731 [Blastomyces dermatitidis ATCC 18188]|uniref:Uncharacterized protein n=1 Tax=Ajellomyces dermatitidis (strain ATCC 18188 / CBS 674.68) TaxID=653446 RepID=F2TKM3_AJEDA|nr:hypothetical protein BDDG_06731 [Blastomyces dermatitidis ATCC 18188]EQL28825.1 hypothetical protein BDFG_08456 [Blastomyces dermatitidis ATCC 26199]
MPVKWTPEMDQQLLLKILETHELSVNASKVLEAWPSNDPKAKPTARAITERLVKIRSRIRTGNGQNPTSTPQKPATPSSHNRSSAKRKRGDDASTGKETIKTEAFVSPTPNAKYIKQEYTDYSDSSIDGMAMPVTMCTPSKRARVPSLLPFGMTTYSEDTDNETQNESSASEFVYSTKVEINDSYGNIHVHEG